MDDAEPLNDAESEAVLRALGPVLEWHKNLYPVGGTDEWLYADVSERRSEEMRSYTVATPEQPNSSCFKAHFFTGIFGLSHSGNTEHAPKHYKTLAAAKAACERHHATGKWE